MSEVHRIIWNSTGESTIDDNLSFIDTSNGCAVAHGNFKYLIQVLTPSQASDLATHVDDTNIYDGSMSGGGFPIP